MATQKIGDYSVDVVSADENDESLKKWLQDVKQSQPQIESPARLLYIHPKFGNSDPMQSALMVVEVQDKDVIVHFNPFHRRNGIPANVRAKIAEVFPNADPKSVTTEWLLEQMHQHGGKFDFDVPNLSELQSNQNGELILAFTEMDKRAKKEIAAVEQVQQTIHQKAKVHSELLNKVKAGFFGSKIPSSPDKTDSSLNVSKRPEKVKLPEDETPSVGRNPRSGSG